MANDNFVRNDLCSFFVSIPNQTDLNDMMYLRVEYLYNVKMTVIKGESLEQPTTMYSDNIAAGMTFTATKGVNFWITFEATQVTSGQFVFTVWFKHVAGAG